MKLTRDEVYALPDQTWLKLNTTGWASIQGIIALQAGDSGIIVGHCSVPVMFRNETKSIEKIVLRFPCMGGVRLLLSVDEIAECFLVDPDQPLIKHPTKQ